METKKNTPWTKTMLIALIAAILLAMTACGSKPASVLNKVEKAYNEKDVYAIIECFDPSVQRFIGGAAKMLGGLFGVDSSAFADMVPFLSKMAGQSGILDDGDWGKCKLEEISTVTNGDTATIEYWVHLTYEDGTKKDFIDTANLVKVDGEWYIAVY